MDFNIFWRISGRPRVRKMVCATHSPIQYTQCWMVSHGARKKWLLRSIQFPFRLVSAIQPTYLLLADNSFSSTHHKLVAPPDLSAFHSFVRRLPLSLLPSMGWTEITAKAKMYFRPAIFPPPPTEPHGETRLPFGQTATRRMFSLTAPPLLFQSS